MVRTLESDRSRRGAVLIVVLGVLVVLSLLAVTFAEVSTLDRKIATTYLDGVRAQLVARAGIERAINEINGSIDRGAYNDPAMLYWGRNNGETGGPDAACPLHNATNPSYAIEKDGDPTNNSSAPMEFDIDGVKTGLSGSFQGSGTHGENGDVYRLRVVDANTMLHVNDGIELGNKGNISQNLQRLLDIVGRQVGVPNAGMKLIEARPPGGYRSKRELERVLGADDFKRMKNYVTTVAWVDHSVVNPVPLSGEVLASYPIQWNADIGMFRYGRSRNTDGATIKMPLKFAPDYCDVRGWEHCIMALDEVNAQWIERTSRAPINVNGAPKPILVALMTGLRGWFITERRKSNPGEGLYQILTYKSYDGMPGGAFIGDEYGFLYSTPDIVGPGDQGTQVAGGSGETASLSAEALADEIIYCRGRQMSPKSGIDYQKIWYGGPFKTWRQFNAFCDGLIDRAGMGVSFNYTDPSLGNGNLLADPRKGIYFDYLGSIGGVSGAVAGQEVAGPSTMVPSRIIPMYACQAIADVLKANFNPNCTLNELNPDENLHMVVDKTDLMCISTEFCFTPMGYFEVESEGLVVETAKGEDLMKVRSGKTVATKTICSMVKAYDIYKETTQAEFYDGDPASRPGHSPVTNNNRTMELGPEPDNGIAPSECRWSGWLQLSTVGSGYKTVGATHARRTVEKTPDESTEQSETAHAHFCFDHRLGFTSAGSGPSVQDPVLRNKQCRNNPDRTESEPGPYGPTRGKDGEYRLARDWDFKETVRRTDAKYCAPSDLRVDGAYVERDSAVMWQNSPSIFTLVGTVAFWAKPSFQPSMTGKARTWFTADTVNTGGKQKTCSIWCLAGHDRAAYADPVNEWRFPTYSPGPWRPSALVLGTSEGWGGVGAWTPSLNHRGHLDHQLPDVMKAHGWLHVETSWNMPSEVTILWVNGELLPYSSGVTVHPNNASLEEWFTNGNPLRIGESSKTWKGGSFLDSTNSTTRNWSSDITVDEFYIWRGVQMARGQNLFSQGRYYRPLMGYEGAYTSKALKFTNSWRNLAPPSTTAAPPVVPTGTGTQTADAPAPPPRGPGGSNPPRGLTTTTTTTLPVGQTRIIAAFWTMYPEIHADDGKPQLVDYHDAGYGTKIGSAGSPLDIQVELDFVVNGKAQHRITINDGGPVENLVVSDSDIVKYFLRVRCPDASVDSVLLASPMIDDVTIFHTRGPEFLAYELQETAL